MAGAALLMPVVGHAQREIVAPAVPDADALAAEVRVLASNPTDLAALLRAGDLAQRLGDTTAAAAFFARAERIDPHNGHQRAGIASVLLQLERPGEALRKFGEAEAYGYAPDNYAADRGLAFDLVGDQARAQRDYRLALQRNPGDGEVRRRYALSLGISGDRERALEEIDPLLRQSDRVAWRVRAFVLAMTGDAAGAEKIATTMLPGGMAENLVPFFQRLPRLSPIDRAWAVHFGEVVATPARLADAKLAPSLPPLPPEPKPTTRVEVAAATPVAKPGRRDRKPVSSPKPARERPVEIAVATPPAVRRPDTASASTSVPTPTPSPSPKPVPVTPVATASEPKPTPAARPTTLASTPTRAPEPVAKVEQPKAATTDVPPVDVTSAPKPTLPVAQPPSTNRPEVVETPPASLVVTTTSSPTAQALPTTTAATTTSPTPGFGGSVVTPPTSTDSSPDDATKSDPDDRDADASPDSDATSAQATTKPAVPATASPVGREDSILARIIANIGVPARELEVPPLPSRAPAETIGQKGTADVAPVTSTAKKPEKSADTKDAKAEKPIDPKAEAKRKADEKKKAEEKKKADAEKAEAKKQAALAKASPSRIWVQVAGGARVGDLPKAWAAVKAKAPAAFRGRQGWTTPLRFTNRVLAGPFKSAGEAQAFVNELTKAGLSSFVFTSAAGQQIDKLDGQ